jgi:gliding motility-associated-like protein
VVKQKQCFISFPNAFTPNNDGRNDRFKIITAFHLSEYLLIVYNRWGQKIFETKDPVMGWDGTVNGRLQAAGTFIWSCSYKRAGISSVTKGSVT